MTIRMTERDRRMLAKCAVCRWLTTGQVKRLYFPEATLNAVQKRLRKLSEAVCAERAPGLRTFLEEYDRSKEKLDQLIRKVQWYERGLSECALEAVVIDTEQKRRLDLLSQELGRRNL